LINDSPSKRDSGAVEANADVLLRGAIVYTTKYLKPAFVKKAMAVRLLAEYDASPPAL
jgi:hypothetical protein